MNAKHPVCSICQEKVSLSEAARDDDGTNISLCQPCKDAGYAVRQIALVDPNCLVNRTTFVGVAATH